MVTKHRKRPCASCPYRKDTPLGYWAKDEFEKVLDSEDAQVGHVFACHLEKDKLANERSVCAGYLLDQKNRGIPNIGLRLALIRDGGLIRALDDVSSKVEMFPDAREMCRVNLRVIAVMQKKAGENEPPVR